jgi:hypothetical protein
LILARGELEKMTATMEVSEMLERVDNIVNMLDEICDHGRFFVRRRGIAFEHHSRALAM